MRKGLAPPFLQHKAHFPNHLIQAGNAAAAHGNANAFSGITAFVRDSVFDRPADKSGRILDPIGMIKLLNLYHFRNSDTVQTLNLNMRLRKLNKHFSSPFSSIEAKPRFTV